VLDGFLVIISQPICKICHIFYKVMKYHSVTLVVLLHYLVNDIASSFSTCSMRLYRKHETEDRSKTKKQPVSPFSCGVNFC